MWKPIELDVECIVCNKTLQKINHDPHEACFNMRKITNRRSRTPNWSLAEKQYLLDLIKERKDIVINKSSNGPNNTEEKDVAWNEILRKLACKFGTKFDGFSIKKVKTQWQNMKRIAREEVSYNGAEVNNYTRQSFEVCNILDIIKDGILKQDNGDISEPSLSTNIEIKTECIDDDMNEPSCSGFNYTANFETKISDIAMLESSASSTSVQTEYVPDIQNEDELLRENMKTAETMTDSIENVGTNALPKEFLDLIRHISTVKELKMESLKEERQIVRAMRETAELNKIIAEQKLKHVLWVNKQEIA